MHQTNKTPLGGQKTQTFHTHQNYFNFIDKTLEEAMQVVLQKKNNNNNTKRWLDVQSLLHQYNLIQPN